MPNHPELPHTRCATATTEQKGEQKEYDLTQVVDMLRDACKVLDKDIAGMYDAATVETHITTAEEICKQLLAEEFAKQADVSESNANEIRRALDWLYTFNCQRYKLTYTDEELKQPQLQLPAECARDILDFVCSRLPHDTIVELWRQSCQAEKPDVLQELWQAVCQHEDVDDDYVHRLINLYAEMIDSSSISILHSVHAYDVMTADRVEALRRLSFSELADTLYPNTMVHKAGTQCCFAIDMLQQAGYGAYDENLPRRIAIGMHRRHKGALVDDHNCSYPEDHKECLVQMMKHGERYGVDTLIEIYRHTGDSMVGYLSGAQIHFLKDVINKDPRTLERLQHARVTVIFGDAPVKDENGAFADISNRYSSDDDGEATLYFEVESLEQDIDTYVRFLQERGIRPSTIALAGHGVPGALGMGLNVNEQQRFVSKIVGGDWSLEAAVEYENSLPLDISSDPSFARLFALMQPDSYGVCRVVLDSCSQASGSDEYEPVAVSVARAVAVARGDTAGVVYASSVPVKMTDVMVTHDIAWLGPGTKLFSTVYRESSGEYEVIEQSVDPPVEAEAVT